MKTLILILIAIVCIGCKPRIIYQSTEVKVPISCEVEVLKKPEYTGNIEEDFLNFFIYFEKISKDLEFCRGDNGNNY